VPVTSVRDGFEHLVAEAAMTRRNAGRYVALCGRAVWATALVRPPGPPCPACFPVRKTVPARGRHRRRANQRGAWARMTALLRHPSPTQSESPQFPGATLPESPHPERTGASDHDCCERYR
jgi:hypothetical protein